VKRDTGSTAGSVTEVMMKTDLSKRLDHVKNNFIVGMAGLQRLQVASTTIGASQHRLPAEERKIEFGRHAIEVEPVLKALLKQPAADLVIHEFAMSLTRTLVRDTVLMIRLAQRMPVIAPAWRFAEAVVACLDNGGIFTGITRRIEWRDKVLDADMVGQPLTLDFLGMDDLWDIAAELRDLASSHAAAYQS
jgi:hypothetical protein